MASPPTRKVNATVFPRFSHLSEREKRRGEVLDAKIHSRYHHPYSSRTSSPNVALTPLRRTCVFSGHKSGKPKSDWWNKWHTECHVAAQ